MSGGAIPFCNDMAGMLPIMSPPFPFALPPPPAKTDPILHEKLALFDCQLKIGKNFPRCEGGPRHLNQNMLFKIFPPAPWLRYLAGMELQGGGGGDFLSKLTYSRFYSQCFRVPFWESHYRKLIENQSKIVNRSVSILNFGSIIFQSLPSI